MCRKRKIRCDQGRPICDQCRRTNRVCPGYRDQLELIFVDVTQSTARKAGASTNSSSSSDTSSRVQGPSRKALTQRRVLTNSSKMGSTGSLADTSFDFDSDSEYQDFIRQVRPISVATNPTMGLSKQEAICFFLHSHNIPGTAIMTDSLTSFLTESGISLGQQAIQSSIYAVASAMLSRVHDVPSLRQASRREYGSTLRLVNAALADPVQSKTNQVLGSVVLLSLYEVIPPKKV